MAAIGRLPETLADRCIMITMQRKSGTERCERLRNLNVEDLRRRCARFVQDNREKIESYQPQIPAMLNDRAADIWEPLLVLAELAGGEWPARARKAAEKLNARDEENSYIGLLLVYIQALFRDTKAERAFSRTVVATVNMFPHSPWVEERKGKPIDELWLSRQLKPYGIHPRTVWIDGETAKGYHREDFEDVFGRYAPQISEDLKRWLAGGEWEAKNDEESKTQGSPNGEDGARNDESSKQ